MRLNKARPESKEETARQAVRSQPVLVPQALAPRNQAAAWLALQQTHGNRFVQRLLYGMVMQRKCACGSTCAHCQSEDAQQGQSTLQSILQHQGSGQPLEPEVRSFMEARFGEDFSGVRVHTDTHAAQTTQQLNALAYTIGRDIFFGEGQYRPQTQDGRQLVAHELTHVVQQGGQPMATQAGLRVSEPGDRFEQEADRVANAIMAEGAECHQRIAGVGGPDTVTEEEDPFAQSIHRNGKGVAVDSRSHHWVTPKHRPAISVLRSLMLQKAASFVAGTVHAVRNAAVQIATGGEAWIAGMCGGWGWQRYVNS